jgi:molybdate transport system substrate-binding protein
MTLSALRLPFAALAACLLAGCSGSKDTESRTTAAPEEVAAPRALVCHVGGTMRPVMQELAKGYEEKTGTKVEVNSAGSGELLAHIELQKHHDPVPDVLMQKGLGVDGWTVAELTPVMAVRKGNPKGIKDLKDLTRTDIEVFLTDPRYSTLGHLLSTILGKADMDLAPLLKQKNVHTHRSGSQVGNMVVMGNADVGLVWNAVVALREKDLEAIPITPYLPAPGVDALTTATKKTYILAPVRVNVATLTCATNPEGARAFAEYLVSPEVAEVLGEYGFTMTNDIIRQEYEAGKPLEGTTVRCKDVAK